MPKEFDECVREGGRVRTKSLPKGKYVHICFDDEGSHAGYPKKKKGGGDRDDRRERRR